MKEYKGYLKRFVQYIALIVITYLFSSTYDLIFKLGNSSFLTFMLAATILFFCKVALEHLDE